MKVHKNAKLTPAGRLELVRRVVEGGERIDAVAQAMRVSGRTAQKWVSRYRQEGQAGLQDRSSRPHRIRAETSAQTLAAMIRLRRERLTAPQIARRLKMGRSTVSKHLKAAGLGKLKDLDPGEPVRRYERAEAGELIHIDIKKLGRIERIGHRITGKVERHPRARGAGWEYVHVAIDDNSRLAYSEILPDEGKDTTTAFLERALAWYASLGVTVQRVMTDNGAAYRSRTFAKACALHRIKHLRTKPYTPRTNGKAERFIQTSLREWAYAQPFASSADRAAELRPWLHRYNVHRPHSGIGGKAPIDRLPPNKSNLSRLYS